VTGSQFDLRKRSQSYGMYELKQVEKWVRR